MTVDFNELERKLAETKVYNAWQYVQSLCETLGYMEVSYEMLGKVYEHRRDTIQLVNKEKFNEAVERGQSSFRERDLKRTNLNIGGYELDDCIFLRKTAMEFFHYGRMSMDVLFQIVNAALLGDDELDVEDKGLLGKLLRKLNSKPEFAALLQLMDNSKNDARYQYLMAFDNYIKHIKTILITIKNSILLRNTDTFEINSFSYGGVSYPTENALSKIEEIRNFVNDTIDEMLKEILNQLPNCISNGQRIQEIHYKQVYSEHEGKTCMEYISFFIDVPNDISDLPSEIKVYPLIIKPNNEIYSFDFRFDKIFIRKQGSDENAIVGVATLKNGLDTNEFYRVYEVTACSQFDYGLYLATFKEMYKEQKLHMNIYAMDGIMLFLRDEEPQSE